MWITRLLVYYYILYVIARAINPPYSSSHIVPMVLHFTTGRKNTVRPYTSQLGKKRFGRRAHRSCIEHILYWYGTACQM